jgi:hypothetical protein
VVSVGPAFAFRSCAEARSGQDGEHLVCLCVLGKVAKRDAPATVVALNNAMPASCRAVSQSTAWAGRRNAWGSCCSAVGASSKCSRAAAVPSFTRGLTLRSSGPAPARHLGRDALAVYHAHRGQGALPARAAQLNVRPLPNHVGSLQSFAWSLASQMRCILRSGRMSVTAQLERRCGQRRNYVCVSLLRRGAEWPGWGALGLPFRLRKGR